MRSVILVAVGLLLGTSSGMAQSISTSSMNWTGTWGFSGPNKRALDIQQADLMRKSKAGFYDSFGPAQSTVIYNTDNRSNYVEIDSDGDGNIDVNHRTGDDIGKNTNVIGAMNTGTTTIDIHGSGNSVTAINSADSAGCLNGSINTATSRNQPSRSDTASVLSTVTAGLNSRGLANNVNAGSAQANCLRR